MDSPESVATRPADAPQDPLTRIDYLDGEDLFRMISDVQSAHAFVVFFDPDQYGSGPLFTLNDAVDLSRAGLREGSSG